MDSYFNYFAYGSNMLTERLTAPDRCPSAKAVGVAFADGYSLDFSKFSKKDKSGKATLFESPGQLQYGVVFTIKKCDLEKLDDAEGLGKGYDKKDNFNVTLVSTGTIQSTFTYIATYNSKHTHLRPFDWYLALVVAGAMQHKLPEEAIADYKGTDFQLDRDSKRKYKELEILKKAKLGDIEQILGSKYQASL